MIRVKDGKGNKTIFMEIGNASRTHQTGIRKALFEIGRENVKHSRKLITTGNKTGIVYRIAGRTHQASAPGQAPASFTGALARSIDYNVRAHVSMEFGDGEPYGKFLEDGTRHMGQRPHLTTTVKDRERENFNTLQRAVRT